jgi:hypothetical protein
METKKDDKRMEMLKGIQNNAAQSIVLAIGLAAEKICDALDRNTAAVLDAAAWSAPIDKAPEYSDIIRGYQMFLGEMGKRQKVVPKKVCQSCGELGEHAGWCNRFAKGAQACSKCGYESDEPFRDCPECDEALRRFEDRKQEP